MLGWLTESFGQWLLVPIYVVFGGYNLFISTIILPFYLLFQGVLVPFTILLNETRIKTVIVNSGYLDAIRYVLGYKQTTVSPNLTHNIEMSIPEEIENSPNKTEIIFAPGRNTSTATQIQTRGIHRTSGETTIRTNDTRIDDNEMSKNVVFVAEVENRVTCYAQKKFPRLETAKIDPTNVIENKEKSRENNTMCIRCNHNSEDSVMKSVKNHGNILQKCNSATRREQINNELVLRPQFHVITPTNDLKLDKTCYINVPWLAGGQMVCTSNKKLVKFCCEDSISFVVFCRQKMVKRLIEEANVDDIKYKQVLSYLLILEKQCQTGIFDCNEDVSMALFNKWKLNKIRKKLKNSVKTKKVKTLITKDNENSKSPPIINNYNHFNQDEIMRMKLLSKLNLVVSDNKKYLNIWRQLCVIEKLNYR